MKNGNVLLCGMVYYRCMKLALVLSLFSLFTLTPITTDAYTRSVAREDRRVYQAPAPAPTPVTPQPSQPTPQPVQPAADFVSAVESEIFRLINIERAANGLAALKVDATLASVARAHSADMAKNNYFSHTNLQGCSSSCRVTNAGYAWSAVGENIYKMTGYKLSAADTAALMVKGWMQSAGHRANILNKNYTYHGVGVAQVGTSIYATDDFARPR